MAEGAFDGFSGLSRIANKSSLETLLQTRFGPDSRFVLAGHLWKNKLNRNCEEKLIDCFDNKRNSWNHEGSGRQRKPNSANMSSDKTSCENYGRNWFCRTIEWHSSRREPGVILVMRFGSFCYRFSLSTGTTRQTSSGITKHSGLDLEKESPPVGWSFFLDIPFYRTHLPW